MFGLALEVSHPCPKDKDVSRMGPPAYALIVVGSAAVLLQSGLEHQFPRTREDRF